MRCHIASLVWADRCLPLSSTRHEGEINREVKEWRRVK